MTPSDLDHVFGRGRVRMVTGAHVEVFREEAAPGERRRYTKRFLCTTEGDFRHWTEREWRILARLVGHGVVAVPEVLRFERGVRGQPSMVQTYDAGVTVDHWSTLLPVRRDQRVLRHVFEDCAHWWALAYHALRALDEIHALQLVHLDLKADNICIPIAPADFDPCVAGQVLRPKFEELALIDFAFSLISGEPLAGPLPIGHQADHGYQSPRLLHALEAGRQGDLGPTRQLDWRCDMFSLAAMLRRYLPDASHAAAGAWTHRRLEQAHALVDSLFEAHHWPAFAHRPHRALMDRAGGVLGDQGLADSLARGWGLDSEAVVPHASSLTPVTRIALPVSMSAPAAADPVGPALACSVPWLRTEPLWAPMPVGPASAPLGRTGPATVPRRARVPAWVWQSCAVGLAAVGLVLVLPGQLGPADRGEAAQTDELSAAMVAAQAEPEAATASAPGASEAAAPPGERASSLRVRPGSPAATDARLAEPKAPEASKGDGRRLASRTQNTARARAAHPSPKATPAQPPRLAVAPEETRGRPKFPRPPRGAGWAQPGPGGAPMAAGRGPLRPASAAARLAGVRPPASTPRVSKTQPVVIAAPRAPTSPPAALPDHANDMPAAVSVGAAGTRSAASPGGHRGPGASGAIVPPDAAPAAERDVAVVSTAEPVWSGTPGGSVSTQDSSPAPANAHPDLPEEFAERAQALMARYLPQLAQRAERLVLRVLHMASLSAVPAGPDAEVLDAALAMRRAAGDALPVLSAAAEDARRLHAAAATAFWSSQDPARALRLELRAFGADPRDAEVAGALAFYQLKQRPVQAETARRLALHALALPQADAPHGRIEDWTTFAIASALAGRERDARNAWFVTLSLAPVERQCRAAVAAYAAHGAPLRTSVEALLARIRQAGRSDESPFCRWPPNWWAGAKVS